MTRLPLLALVLAGAGCITGNEDFNQFAFDRALRTWSETGPPSYRFQFTRQCTCPGPKTPVRVVVRNGVVESRTVVDTEDQLDPQYDSAFPAIPGVFAIIRNTMGKSAYSLVAEYDATYGFPVRIELDFTPATVTDDARYFVSAFTPLD